MMCFRIVCTVAVCKLCLICYYVLFGYVALVAHGIMFDCIVVMCVYEFLCCVMMCLRIVLVFVFVHCMCVCRCLMLSLRLVCVLLCFVCV